MLHGPHPLSSQGQVKLPRRLAKEMHLEEGDSFYWRRSDDDPSVLEFIPSEVVERRYSAGERLEDERRPRAEELETGHPDAGLERGASAG